MTNKDLSVRDDEESALRFWRALLRSGLLMGAHIRREFVRWDLTGPQWDALMVLGEAGEEGITLGQLSQRMLVTPGNVTGIVDRLEEAGFVNRRAHPKDRRAILAALTPAGREVYEQAEPAHRRNVAALLATLPLRRRREITSVLDKLADRLQATADAQGQGAEGPPHGESPP